MNALLKKIADLKIKIDALRPLNKGELEALKKWYDVTYTYNSNAIEGNSLTLEETRLVIEDGLTVKGKPLREIYEAVNHKKAIDQIYKAVQSKTMLTENLLKTIHSVVMHDIDEENAGQYRKIQVYISGEEKALPTALQVPVMMKSLFQWLNSEKKSEETILKTIAKWHYDFVKIHPFVDGNGRTARLIANILLLQSRYPLQIIPIIRRTDYIQSLHSSRTFNDFYHFFLEVQYENMKDYLRMVGSA